MKGIKILSNARLMQSAFKRCCQEYTHLEMYVAWVGNPKNSIPFTYLKALESVKVNVGIAFDQTNPEGLKYLMDKNHEVVIIKPKVTYHPKLYFFSGGNRSALIMGSSNFTYSGFFENVEGNILIEGEEYQGMIQAYLDEMKEIIKKYPSFVPTSQWLEGYKKDYDKRQKALKESKMQDEATKEEYFVQSNTWLGIGDWEIYMEQIKKGLKVSERLLGENLHTKLALFEEYAYNLNPPWSPSLFDTIENRRRILGIAKYGGLGHVGASGHFKQLLAKGDNKKKMKVCTSMNTITSMKIPLDYQLLKVELTKLTEMGHSIKVWGRLLAITRPDLYYTISSENVRQSVSKLLEKPKSYFETVDGYIDLLKLIHQSPWFNSPCPQNSEEAEIWQRRVAFLDVVFYSE